MNETRSSQLLSRYERETLALRYSDLGKHPIAQAEAIARHYVAHATIARDLLMLVEFRRNAPGGNAAEPFITILTERIAANHAHDLGIELRWPTDDRDQSP